jgi:alkanesulfonate monooxygenase SsuD/methylene tetrahydromethanopterin reductase-like flavin-dependent oxidoreductase (luciferase family)
MKQLLTEEAVSFSGRHYRVEGLPGRPRPVQKPHPPIFVGAMGRRLLAVAARLADSVGVGFSVWRSEVTEVQPDEIVEKIAWIREAAGQRFEQIELGYTVFRTVLTDGTPDPGLPRSPHVLAGTVDQIVEEILARRERYGFSYVQVMEQQMDAFAPVVERLAGR